MEEGGAAAAGRPVLDELPDHVLRGVIGMLGPSDVFRLRGVSRRSVSLSLSHSLSLRRPQATINDSIQV